MTPRMECGITDGRQPDDHEIGCECVWCEEFDEECMAALRQEKKLEVAREIAESINEAMRTIFGTRADEENQIQQWWQDLDSNDEAIEDFCK